MALGNSDKIREAHNSFTRQHPFMVDDEDKKAAKEDDDVFHFISFVPFKGQLYELDGLQSGPIHYGDCTAENWVSKARDAIQARIQKYAASEIKFNLLAIVGDKLQQMQAEQEKLKLLETWITKKLAGETPDAEAFKSVEKEIGELASQTNDALAASLDQTKTSFELLGTKIADEQEHQANWKSENERRRHNYVPAIFAILEQLAKKNMLSDLFKEA